MEFFSSTTDPEAPIRIEDDDREYYNFSGHLIHVRPSRSDQEERKLLLQIGLG